MALPWPMMTQLIIENALDESHKRQCLRKFNGRERIFRYLSLTLSAEASRFDEEHHRIAPRWESFRWSTFRRTVRLGAELRQNGQFALQLLLAAGSFSQCGKLVDQDAMHLNQLLAVDDRLV